MNCRATFAVLVVGAIGCCVACSLQGDILQRVRSPSGQLDAVLVQPKTDATVGFVDWVYVVPAGQLPRGKPMFVADHVSPSLGLIWTAAQLTITAQHARVFKSSSTVMTGGVGTPVNVKVAEREP